MGLRASFGTPSGRKGEILFNYYTYIDSPVPHPPSSWRLFRNESPAEFHAAMTKGLPPGTDLIVTLHLDGRLDKLSFSYNEGERGENFTIQRWIDHENGDIFASGGSEISSNLRGHGITKVIDGHVYPLYIAQGVKTVKIDATSINTYAAARRGFVPRNCSEEWENIQVLIGEKLEFLESRVTPFLGPLPIKAVDAIREGISMASPKGMWKVVDERTLYGDMPIGKLLTIENTYLTKNIRRAFQQASPRNDSTPFDRHAGWSGYMDISGKDPEFLARISAYTGVKIEPAAKPSGNNATYRPWVPS